MKSSAILFVLSLFFISAHAQNQGYISDLYMSGKWKAECTEEIIDKASIRYCPLCIYRKTPSDTSSWGHPKNIELNFMPDSLTIIQDDRKTTVHWTRNPDNHSFDFMFNNKSLHFRMFLYGKDKRIIEDSDGMLMVLEKVN